MVTKIYVLTWDFTYYYWNLENVSGSVKHKFHASICEEEIE
ncbi:hypothetical protein EMIT079MI2_50092 [Bacillus sp. IT-79MI2]